MVLQEVDCTTRLEKPDAEARQQSIADVRLQLAPRLSDSRHNLICQQEAGKSVVYIRLVPDKWMIAAIQRDGLVCVGPSSHQHNGDDMPSLGIWITKHEPEVRIRGEVTPEDE
jgi:hypothetical protein